VHEEPDEVEIRRAGRAARPAVHAGPDPKTVKNRLHIDLRPDDQEAEVERLVDMGARPVDIGQHDVSWVVLADPEGNEFCVLSRNSVNCRSGRDLAGRGADPLGRAAGWCSRPPRSRRWTP
jgi:hypothetical protein